VDYASSTQRARWDELLVLNIIILYNVEMCNHKVSLGKSILFYDEYVLEWLVLW